MNTPNSRVFVIREPEPRSLPELEAYFMEISAELREAAELLAGYRSGIADAARYIAFHAVPRVPGAPDAVGLARKLAAMVDITEEIEELLPAWADAGRTAED